MHWREREKIKRASNKIDAGKAARKQAAITIFKYILFGGLGLLSWTFTMLLVIIIATDIDEGIKAFSEVNGMLYQLYAIMVSISIFIFLIEYIFKKKDDGVDEIIVERPANYKYK